ncbi:hypothetical protein PVAND_011931 [Polypedilum vanderplanki]|uniref:D-3-phosphoglycerate dehydrogenase n=1 Tax=Polypedilum vanderplanki TaxID=319348 RepID=A0A9J6CK28_POLVA|nr:hypothetical protein PVAND_011931 [Polypedilum vanderplanki]
MCKNKYHILILIVILLSGYEVHSSTLCYTCDGDENCLQPISSTSTINCSSSCYIGINTNGKTVRGCSSDFSSTNLCSSSINSSALCFMCDQDYCNFAVYPTNRISCKTCIGLSCQNLLTLNEKICNNYKPVEACITIFNQENEAIYRDCYADAASGTQEFCDDSNNLECSKCQLSNCNVDIKRRGSKCFKCTGVECFDPSIADIVDCQSSCYVGINQVGQTVRDCSSSLLSCENNNLECRVCDEDFCNSIAFPIKERRSCISCRGDNCLSMTSWEQKFCEIYGNNEKCVTLFDSKNKIIEKGCLSTIVNVDFKNQSICDFDNCNIQNSIEENEVCISCNSETDSNCITNPLQSDLVACSTNQCYSRFQNNIVDRGCENSLTSSCTEPDCKICMGSRCNQNIIPSNRQSCHVCSGLDCLGDSQICLRSGIGGCLTIFNEDSKAIYRNCYSNVNDVVQSFCDDPTNLECTKCENSNCNIDMKRRGTKCFKCSGIECFTISSLSNTLNCQSGCFVGINEFGLTVRDCASSSLTCSENASYCQVCESDFCNGITFPIQNRRICLNCVGDDCLNNDESKYCEKFGTFENCVTVFDSTNKVYERGCSSSLSLPSANNTNRLMCNFDKCNTHKTMNEQFYCIGCNSENDKNCILNLRNTNSIACTTNECYSRVLENGIIERGCATGLTTTCSNENCLKCNQTLCNDVEVPKNRHSCYKCEGSSCANIVGRIETCLNQNTNSCVTIFGEGSLPVYRNCYSDVNEIVQSLCDDSGNIDCVKCNSKNCNILTSRAGTKCFKCSGLECFIPSLSNIIDCKSSCYLGVDKNGQTVRDCSSSSFACTEGSMDCLVCNEDFCNGITFPVINRRSCIRCIGNECQNSDNSMFCPIFNSAELCTTVFDSTNQIIERGCSSSLTSTSVNNTNKLSCNFDNCNTHKAINQIFYCISCDSDNDKKCITDPKQTATITCSTNECYSRLLTNGVVQRGCASILTSSCSNENCIKCNGTQCNSVNVPSSRQSCLKCSGNSCSLNNAIIETCLNHNNNNCITIFDQDSKPILRNCYSDVNEVVQSICDDENNLECTKCTSKNCNTVIKRRGTICLKCNGQECFNSVVGSNTIACQSSGCYVGLNSLGETVRGCASSFQNSSVICATNDTDSKACLICNDDFCNAITYPTKNRAQCHVCVGSQCAANEDNLSYCGRYQENCVTVFDNNEVIERGCLSSLINKRQCVLQANKCKSCGQNGCNNMTTLSSQVCINCNSQNDTNCVHNPSLAGIKFCSSSGCYTRLVDGNLIRGCKEDLQNFVCDSTTNCQSCSSNDKCNSGNYPDNRLSCVSCRNASECQKPTMKKCNLYKSNDKCVTIFDNYKLSMKGCLADQSITIQNQCASNSSTCISCSNNNCNTDVVRQDEACIVCSSDVDSNCAQKPNTLFAKKCFIVSDGQCFTRILNGVTIRGCKGDLSSAIISNCNGENCTLSTGQGTNKKIFPTKRLKCHHCNSQIDKNCSQPKTDKDEILPCKKYSGVEKCIIIKSSSGTVRGCEADFTENICNGQNCFTCNDKDVVIATFISQVHFKLFHYKMPVDIKTVLVCDAVDQSCIDLLKSNEISVDYKLKLPKEELLREVKNYDAVIVRSDTKITADVIASGVEEKLRVIGRAGVGVDNIDIDAATKHNVIVLNTPGGNSIAATELTCLLLAALGRPVCAANASMKEGRWDRKIYSGTELYGKTLAILGLGRIGREVGFRMKAWGMKIIGYDPITTHEQAAEYGIEKMELDEIWPLADYITLHVPLIPSTKNLISSDSLSKCKNGVKVVNVARGGVIDEEAIFKALESGKCGGAAFDVYEEEPPKKEITKKLIAHPKVVATPHLGASTKEAQIKVAVEVSEQFIALTGKSKEFTQYNGVVNREILKTYF